MGKTSIEWATDTWNPIRARRLSDGKDGWHCEKVSAGCAQCYAETLNGRRLPGGGTGLVYSKLRRREVQTFVDDAVLRQPLSWRKPRRVFVCSMTDLFGEWVSDEQIDRVVAVMALAPQCTFMVLTKRAKRMREYLAMPMEAGRYVRFMELVASLKPNILLGTETFTMRIEAGAICLQNVWLGVSVEDQRAADERIPQLIATPAEVRFVSAEPLLGPIDLDQCGATPCEAAGRGPEDYTEPQPWPGVDWIIVGGESGPGARPCDVAWVRSIVQQCRAVRVAAFVKQVGARPKTDHRTRPAGEDFTWTLLLRDRKGGDPSEWPEDLRVREFPA